ncbi:MAG: TIGR02147 family protein [Pseudobdellovibrionaceae bacterium]|nr:TIGR02147 family protein [Pseudobdellovibrionaceae bacterium]
MGEETKQDHLSEGRVDILAYSNPSDYLRAVYTSQKRFDTSIAWPAFAKRLGISLSLLKMLLNGQRQYTIEHIHRIASCLKLSYEQHEYFETMVLLHQSRDPVQTSFYQLRRERFTQHKKAQSLILNPRLLRMEWYVPGLIVYLIQVARSQNIGLDAIDYGEAARLLGLAESRIRETVAQLRQTGVLEVKDQRLAIVLDNLAGSVSVKKLVRQITEESLTRLRNHFHDPDTFFHSVACTFYPSDLPEIRLGLKKLIEQYSQDPKADYKKQKVYQCLFHIWPFA